MCVRGEHACAVDALPEPRPTAAVSTSTGSSTANGTLADSPMAGMADSSMADNSMADITMADSTMADGTMADGTKSSSLVLMGDLSNDEYGSQTWGQINQYVAQTFGERFVVNGNGTSWLYAIMGALGRLQHGKHSPSAQAHWAEPTALDVRLSQVLLAEMQRHLRELPTPSPKDCDGNSLKDHKDLLRQMEELNVWVPGMKGNAQVPTPNP